MRRFTFVVQVHPDGIRTLENLNTHERVPVTELAEIGPRIERWLDAEEAGSAGGGQGETAAADQGARQR